MLEEPVATITSFSLVKLGRGWRKPDISLRPGNVGVRRQRSVTIACVINSTPRHCRPRTALFLFKPLLSVL